MARNRRELAANRNKKMAASHEAATVMNTRERRLSPHAAWLLPIDGAEGRRETDAVAALPRKRILRLPGPAQNRCDPALFQADGKRHLLSPVAPLWA